MAVAITISIKLNSQSVSDNTSNVTVNVNASWTKGSFNQLQKSGWLKIDGNQYDFTSSFNYNQKTSGVQTLFTKTVNVTHNNDGTKTLACSASYTSGVSSGTVGASVPDYALPTISRKSTLSVGNGTLGTAQTLTVTEQASSFTHTITAKCGSESTTICTKSTSNSISFTPPLSWASQNTTGTSVSVTYTITTYNGNTSVGSNTYTKTCSIPTSVKPSCSISVSDATDIYKTHGVYVKTASRFRVVVTPTTSYGSAIVSYSTTANGGTYTAASFTTDFLSSAGSLTIKATVTDKRGRKGTASVTVSVHDYSPPRVSKLTVHRCDEDGGANDNGEFVKVVFDAEATDVNDQTTSSLYFDYKKTSESTYTTVALVDDTLVVKDYSHVFPADSGSSYDVRVRMIDVMGNTASRATVVSTAFTLMHWRADGRGLGIGKIAELEGVLDIGLQTKLTGGLLYPVLEPGTDLDDVRSPNTYVGANASTNNYENCPLDSGTFTLEVISAGEDGQVLQRLTRCYKLASTTYERFYYSGSWGEWSGGWIYPDIGSEFAVYSSNGDSPPMCRKDGRVVEVRGIVKPKADIAGDTSMHTIFTLPDGYKPSSPIYTICQGSGNCTWLLRVNPGGTVDLSRYRSGGDSATASAGTWLPFHVTYLV